MVDITVKVLTPATTFGFISLDEAKTFLGLSSSTPTEDEQLQFMIDISSATIMRVCNRVFAREEVAETWRDLDSRRVFLTHWPVAEADIESVDDNGIAVVAPNWELEERSGKLSNYSGWAQPTTVTYWGGYDLPDEAPLPLKQATCLLVRDAKLAAMRLSLSGVRSLSHKSSRVQFYDTSKIQPAHQGIVTMTGDPIVDSLLSHYIRIEV